VSTPNDASASKLSWERPRIKDNLSRRQLTNAMVAGVGSGLLSWLWMMFGPVVAIDYVPVVPALFFWGSCGLVLMDLAGSPARAFLLLPAIYLSWHAALKAALLWIGDPYKSEPNVLMCGVTGGLVGAVLVLAASALLLPSARGTKHILPAIVLGTVSGSSLALNIPDGSRHPVNLGLALVFITWQASMLACLSFAISRNSVMVPLRLNVETARRTCFAFGLATGGFLAIYAVLAVFVLAGE
jgi:hypothetical protein